ncbi:bromodomain containing protein [Nitzschia inconspicua]|uniref:Bromodomain containing protein n=1 Tax=Nitzschia inconspicua TaxID=303405 RepID=A0A9K3L4F3_9STRA|nr:bromodomain containing protein [Nitzschia inconspicua]
MHDTIDTTKDHETSSENDKTTNKLLDHTKDNNNNNNNNSEQDPPASNNKPPNVATAREEQEEASGDDDDDDDDDDDGSDAMDIDGEESKEATITVPSDANSSSIVEDGTAYKKEEKGGMMRDKEDSKNENGSVYQNQSAMSEDNVSGNISENDGAQSSDGYPEDKVSAQKRMNGRETGGQGQNSQSASGSNSNGRKEGSSENVNDPSVKEESQSKTPTKTLSSTSGATNTAAPSASGAPNPPILRGTLSYSEEERKHYIRGNWNFEHATGPPQRFDLSRNLSPNEDVKKLIVDAEFSGSFTMVWSTHNKGKIKERSRNIQDKNVKIIFTENRSEGSTDQPTTDGKKTYKIDGTGFNEFGLFNLDGNAEPSGYDDGQYRVVLKKHYITTNVNSGQNDKKKFKKKMVAGEGADESVGPATTEDDPDELPDPSPQYNDVVCLRGKLSKTPMDELTGLGATSVVTRITGFWANSLEQILLDPQNAKGLFNLFELEHKSSSNPGTFAVSGRYSGFFYVQTELGKKKLPEKDVTLRFRKNNKGYHNVEGKGSNAYGKYTISGTLTEDGVLTIFRHFAAAKTKARPVTSAPPPINEPGQSRRPSLPVIPEKKLSFDDVKVPDEDGLLEPFQPPANGTYSAVSRGVLRVNDDGSHGCQGKWAMTREHWTNNITNGFKVRLEPHFVLEALAKDPSRPFPVDSDMYKGSFQMKKGTRQQKIVDTQVVMKFRQNTQGSFNVYGKGVNSIGIFNLSGVLVMSGNTGGQMELFRTYPPELLAAPAAPVGSSAPGISSGLSQASLPPPSSLPSVPPRPGGLVRRESTRMVKLPSRLEDDDPDAQLSRIMDKCNQVLRFLRTKDTELGSFFARPVDPVALQIPTYPLIIKEPMDLSTLQAKMDSGVVKTPEEFARLARLIFNNAMTFNVDPSHMVHVAARNLLTFFNQKFEPVEKQLASIRIWDAEEKKRNKGDKKRKRGEEEMKSPKRRRLDEAKEIAAANASAMSALVSAAGTTMEVTRTEFNMMVQMISKLQQQVVQTYHLIADLSSDDPTVAATESVTSQAPLPDPTFPSAGKKKTRKKVEPPKTVEKPAVVEDDSTPLTTEEQEFLTRIIPEMPDEALEGVIKIIREFSSVAADDDEIDLEIDALDSVTQRKLLKYVTKFHKPPKGRKPRGPKKENPVESQPTKKAPTKKAPYRVSSPVDTSAVHASKSNSQLFSFQNDESDSDGEISDDSSPADAATQSTQQQMQSNSGSKGFRLGMNVDDSDEDDDDDADSEAIPSWNITNIGSAAVKKDGDEDDAWGAAREEALAAKAREEDKRKREEKLKAEAEQQKTQRLAEAVAYGEEIKAQRQAEEEEEARLREEKEKEAEEERLKARENARKQVQSVEQTVDLDDQRDLMKQLEQNYMDTEMGGASPSSDFGF